MYWIPLSRLFVMRIRMHTFFIDFKESFVAIAVKTKRELLQKW